MGGGRRSVEVTPKNRTFVNFSSCETSYPVSLIEHVLRVKGVYVVDEIMRDESPSYVEHHLKWDIFSYVEPGSFDNRRVLDFGAGSGASTMVLARLLPRSTRFLGVELVPEFVELARHRAQYWGIDDRVSFHTSPHGTRLPDGIGRFDYIVFSAVYEHLLPEERRTVLPVLWRHLRPGGALFLNQTPYRWFPIELHTTGLPFINYLPDKLAGAAARRFSWRISADDDWATLLRKGIRGGTVSEIIGIVDKVDKQGEEAELLQPSRLGVKDQIGLWYRLSSAARAPLVKGVMKAGFRAVKAVSGVTMIPTLSLAIQKKR